MSWHEFVHVEVQIFYAGENVIDALTAEEVSIDDGLWLLTSGKDISESINEDGTIQSDAWCFWITPLHCAVGNGNMRRSLLQYEVDNMGWPDTFSAEHLDELKRMCGGRLGTHKRGSFMTVWYCNAGKDEDTWAGPGEYYSEWSLARIITPDEVMAAKPSGGAA